MTGDPAWTRSNLMRVTRNTADSALANALTQNARRTLAWLSAQGVRLIKAGPDGLRRNSLAPPGMRRTGLNWRGRSGDVLLRTLGQRLLEKGGQLIRGAQAECLHMEAGRCVGAEWSNTAFERSVVRAKYVVIADGGFQANLDLLRRFVSAAPGAFCNAMLSPGRVLDFSWQKQLARSWSGPIAFTGTSTTVRR